MAVAPLQRITNASLQALASSANSKLSPTTPFEFIGWIHIFSNSGLVDSPFLIAIPFASKGDIAVNAAKLSPDQRVWRLDDDDSTDAAHWTDVKSSWQVFNDNSDPTGGSDGDRAVDLYTSEIANYRMPYWATYHRVDGVWIAEWGNAVEFDRLLAALRLAIVAEGEWDSLLTSQQMVHLHNPSPASLLSITTPEVAGATMLLMKEISAICVAGDTPSFVRKLTPYWGTGVWKHTSHKAGWTMHGAPDGYRAYGKIHLLSLEYAAGYTWSYTSSNSGIIKSVTAVRQYFYNPYPTGYDAVRFYVEFNGDDGSPIDDGDWWIEISATGLGPVVMEDVFAEVAWRFETITSWVGTDASDMVMFTDDGDTWEKMAIPDTWIDSPSDANVNRAKIEVGPLALDRGVFYQSKCALFTTNKLSATFDPSPGRYGQAGVNPGDYWKPVAIGGDIGDGTSAFLPGVCSYGPACLRSNRARVSYGAVSCTGYVYSITLRRGVTGDPSEIVSNTGDLSVEIGWVDGDDVFHGVKTFTIPSGNDAVTEDWTLLVAHTSTTRYSWAYECEKEVLVNLCFRQMDGYPIDHWKLLRRPPISAIVDGVPKRHIDAISFNAVEERLTALP